MQLPEKEAVGMNCPYCHGVGTLEKRLTRFCAYDIPSPFLVERVPATVCRLCGDKSFSGDVVAALEKIANKEAKVSDLQAFRVFDFCQFDRASERSADENTSCDTTSAALADLPPSFVKETKKHLMRYP